MKPIKTMWCVALLAGLTVNHGCSPPPTQNANDNANANGNANDNQAGNQNDNAGNANDNAPANQNDNTPPPPANACEAVNNQTFEPLVPPAPGGTTQISFAVADGENTFQTFGDFIFGTFECNGFNLTGETIPFGGEPVQQFTGSYDLQTGILTWGGAQYRLAQQ